MVTLLAVLALVGCDTYNESPTGRKQILLFSEQDMAQQGQLRFEQMRQTLPVNRDPRLAAYIECIVSRLAAVAPSAIDWQVQVFDSPEANAFALPGGYIGIYTGMLKVANSDDQMAAVIAHEIAHVLARHGNEQVSRSEMKHLGLNVADFALDLAEIDQREFVMAALDLGAEVGLSLPFSRAQETEADSLGMAIMAQAGFNPQAAVQLWQKMASMGPGQVLELLSTHPSATSRIEDLQAEHPQWTAEYQAAKRRVNNQCR
ncbi:M48 family metallopeptidase [Shewanella sp. NIFS-20-20]|nr:M48 family metallopeptidase [Shewanella sp. NIFS-20-20]